MGNRISGKPLIIISDGERTQLIIGRESKGDGISSIAFNHEAGESPQVGFEADEQYFEKYHPYNPITKEELINLVSMIYEME